MIEKKVKRNEIFVKVVFITYSLIVLSYHIIDKIFKCPF